MNFKDISIHSLIVNPENDRHGPTPSEETAIFWLFENKAPEMKKLALRIAKAGRVFDSPLVVKKGKKFLVKDGNRRVTCVKLLRNPDLTPPKYKKFFISLRDKYSKLPAEMLTCQIEGDIGIADEIVGLRHNGKQDGAGQVMWGPREKANHANRIQGKSDYSWAQKVEEYLNEHGYQDEALSIKRSTLDKILDTQQRRTRFGILEDSDGKLTSKYSQAYLLKLILKLVDDMKTGNLTLKNLLTSKDKNDYIDILASKGYVKEDKPPVNPKGDTPTSPKPSPKEPSPKPSNPTPEEQDTLIKRRINYHFKWTDGQSKISLAWEQLQYHLTFLHHKFAIAVVLRTLLDLTEQNFRNKRSLLDKQNLAKNLKNTGQKLVELKLLDKDNFKDITRVLDDKNSSISIENLQRILHSKSQMPSKDDLITMWDCLEPLIVSAIKSSQKN